jgi:hypothetical protein
MLRRPPSGAASFQAAVATRADARVVAASSRHPSRNAISCAGARRDRPLPDVFDATPPRGGVV